MIRKLHFRLNGEDKKIILIGSAHVSDHSISEVKYVISHYQPDAICLELDQERLETLISDSEHSSLTFKSKPIFEHIGINVIKEIGFKSFLFSILTRYSQNKIGKMFNLSPGSEMLTAYREALSRHIPVFLIDAPIHLTLSKLNQAITTKLILTFIYHSIYAIIFPRKFLKNKLRIRAKTKSQLIMMLTHPNDALSKKVNLYLKKHFYEIYVVLVHNRNKVMANNIINIAQHYNNILVVTGAAHLDGLTKMIKTYLKLKKRDKKNSTHHNYTSKYVNI